MDRNKVCMKKGGLALGIAFGFAALAVLVLAGGACALSNDGGGSWNSSRNLTITNPGAAFPTGANASGADVRFEKDGAELAYWVEEWNSSAMKGLVWVKVGSIPAGESGMRMWYGNPGAQELFMKEGLHLLIRKRNIPIIED